MASAFGISIVNAAFLINPETLKERKRAAIFITNLPRGIFSYSCRHENSARRGVRNRGSFRSPDRKRGTLPPDSENSLTVLAQKAKNRAENSIMPGTKRELKRARQFRQVRAIVKREKSSVMRERGAEKEEEMIDANYAKTKSGRGGRARLSSANFISRLYAIERSKQCVEKI